MQTQSFRFVVCSIIASLTFLNLAVVSSPASGENGAHFCGFTGQQPDNRRFARSLANLNVGEPRAVRMIYFLPNDRPYRVEVVQRMKDEILKVQTFFAEQMDAHGYGKRTFRVETSAQGEPIVHRVEGGHPDSLYDNNPGTQSFREIEQAGFNLTRNVHLIVEDISSNLIRDAAGVGTSLGKNGGYALVPGSFEFVVVAHEMGHAFGLEHDFRDGAYIMSYGPGRSRLSACAARFLAMHPYFNPGILTERVQPPTVELISPHTYPVGSRSVPVRLQVNDSEGLHHLFLIAHSGLQTCRGLAGERDALVEFNYDGAFVIQGFYSLSDSVTHPITALVIDTDGNVSESSINLTEFSSYHIDTLKGHGDSVRTVSFSDSGALASGSKDRTIRLWNVAARQNVAILYGHTHWVESVSFSDEGTLASGSGDGTVKLWDVAAEHEITTFRHTGWVSSVSILPDGRTVASGSGDGTVRLWDVATKQNFTTLTHGNPVSCVSFSSDGPTLAFGSVDGTVKLWDVAAERDITMFRHTDWVSSVSFSSDGLTLASGSGDGTVKLRDVITQQNMGILLHGSGVISVSFSRDGRTLASGAADGTLKLWDVASGANFATFGNVGTINSVSFSPEGGTLAAGTAEGTIALWDVTGLMDERLEATTEIDIPDSNLRAAIATTLGKSPSASIVRGNMATLTKLEASAAGIRNLAVLEHASDLTFLNIRDNNISDIAPLVANTGLSSRDEVHIQGNPLSYISIYTHVPALQERGVEVFFDNRTPQRVSIISGGNQEGLPFGTLANPFIVEVRDENNAAFGGVPVTFTVTSGGGTLSVRSTVTDSEGRAESVITLGPDPGTNTVQVAVTGMHEKHTITAIAKSPPEAISISDPNLDSAVRESLGIASSDAITQYTMLRLENLNADDRGITDLTGIKGGTNLKTLHLGNNSISDISALAGLTSLTWLYLWYNDISDISAVTGLTNLTELYLDNNSITNISAVSGLTNLKTLVLWNNSISDISAVGGLTNLTFLSLWSNAISDMSAVEDLTNLTSLNIGYNSISDISPLVANTGLGSRDKVDIRGNPLSHASIFTHIPALQERGVEVNFDKRTPHKSRIVVGDDQEGLPGEALAKPYVVEVRDENNIAFEGVPVEFTVSSGSGSLSVTSVTTDSNGRAESILTLGPNPGENTVTVSVTGIQEEQTFTAEGIRIPKTLAIITGNDQDGPPGSALDKPFVVEVRGQSGESLPGVQVTFAVSSGGGTLSVTIATTDSNGQAESTLTLGPNPGTNTVEVTVTGVQGKQTFTAEGVQIPKTFVIISGENQQGLPGAPLVNPFVVEVLGPSDNPLPGIQVTFSVTSGGGRLSATTATTDSDGRAESTLTLGPKPGANTVTVSVAGIQGEMTFSAEGIRTPRAFWIISGFDQKGFIGEPLPRPIIVEVRGQSGEPFPDAQVTFTVTSGGGTLSVISVTTDSNGRAMSTLTLGPNPGTNSVEVAVTRIQEKQTVSAIGELPPIPEDVNMDDVVNILDLVSVASVLGDKGTDLAADVNGDGIVNILDLVKVAGALGDAAAAPSAWYRDLEIAPTRADVGEWLAQAQGLDLTDATSQRGVLFLEQLMAVLTPKETALLANFPNPFNPETWIPYQLAGDADVTLTIYDTSGIMVRRLDLGHQLAGFYTNRGNAAYWDGRNENGESVASGVYFYQLGTPSFRQIRRMVILK